MTGTSTLPALPPATRADNSTRAWFRDRALDLRPHYAATGPGGLTVRQQVEISLHVLHYDQSETGVINALTSTLIAYAIAGLCSPFDAYRAHADYLITLAEHHEQADNGAHAEQLRRQAEHEHADADALEASDRDRRRTLAAAAQPPQAHSAAST